MAVRGVNRGVQWNGNYAAVYRAARNRHRSRGSEMSSRPGTVSDRGRVRKDPTSSEGSGGARCESRIVSHESVRSRDTDGGNLCGRTRLCEAENPAKRLALAGSRAIAPLSRAGQAETGVVSFYVWLRAAAGRS